MSKRRSLIARAQVNELGVLPPTTYLFLAPFFFGFAAPPFASSLCFLLFFSFFFSDPEEADAEPSSDLAFRFLLPDEEEDEDVAVPVLDKLLLEPDFFSARVCSVTSFLFRRT